MFLKQFLTRGVIFMAILIGFLYLSPVSFPSISIARVPQAAQQAELPESALPLHVITGTALPQPTKASAPVIEPEPPQEVTAPAATPIDPAEIDAVWQAWIIRNHIKDASMALGARGEILLSANTGDRTADTLYPVASLSKAVTAMCLNTLLAQSEYGWDTPLSDLEPVWETLGMRPHAVLGNLPLSALATHTSGLPKNIKRGKTAGEGRDPYTQIQFARKALRDPRHMSSKRSHSYSNVNYALLGQIIEGLSGQPYGDTCQQRVMAPAGATSARVAGSMWATAGFGGWSASAQDYARFIMHWYDPARPWVAEHATLPFDPKSGAGLGVYHRFTKTGHRLNHTGKWRSKNDSINIGALFVTSPMGTVFVANWHASLPANAYTDLRKSISAVLH